MHKIPDALLGSQSWIHLEGRNVLNLLKLMQKIRCGIPTSTTTRGPIVSLEIERTREADVNLLVPYADVVFFSKEYVHSQCVGEGEINTPEAFLRQSFSTYGRPNAVFVCGWGSLGAYSLWDDQLLFEPAVKLAASDIRDTIGAGDSFIGGYIHAFLQGCNGHSTLACVAREALRFACRTAERKIIRMGFDLGEKPRITSKL